MKTLEIHQATAPLAEYARKVKEEPVILTARGKPVAALVPIENADLETATLSTDPRFIAIIERSRARQRSEGGISDREIRRRLRLKGAGARDQEPQRACDKTPRGRPSAGLRASKRLRYRA